MTILTLIYPGYLLQMNIKLMAKGAKSLIIPRAYTRPKSVEEINYLVWNSV